MEVPQFQGGKIDKRKMSFLFDILIVLLVLPACGNIVALYSCIVIIIPGANSNGLL